MFKIKEFLESVFDIIVLFIVIFLLCVFIGSLLGYDLSNDEIVIEIFKIALKIVVIPIVILIPYNLLFRN